MKNFIFCYFLQFLLWLLYAQTDSKHLTFKGIPIDGKLNDHVTKMKGAGFKYLEKDDGNIFLEGDFAGFTGCLVIVSTLKDVDIVSTNRSIISSLL